MQWILQDDKHYSIKAKCNVPIEINATTYYVSFFFSSSQEESEQWRKWKAVSQSKIKIGNFSCWTNNTKTCHKKLALNVIQLQQLPET